jgi:hypothetical protein
MSDRDTLTTSEVEHALALGLEEEVPWLAAVARDNLRLRGLLASARRRLASRGGFLERLERQVERLEALDREA